MVSHNKNIEGPFDNIARAYDDHLQEAMAPQDRLAYLHHRQGGLQEPGGRHIKQLQAL